MLIFVGFRLRALALLSFSAYTVYWESRDKRLHQSSKRLRTEHERLQLTLGQRVYLNT